MPETKLTGQTLGKYTLERYIDGGAFGEVYQATHQTLNMPAAVKVLYPDRSGDVTARQRFIQEAQCAAGLDHPYIVRILDLGVSGETVYIAMEYLPGGNLKQWRAAQGDFSPRQVVPLLSQAAQALDYAHSQGLVHRDVKPTNILLAADGSARLADFGLLRPLDAPHLTQLGRTVGTPAYTSPEQAEARPTIDGRADQYSLGVVAYELLAGQLPFQGENSTAVALMHVTKPPPPPSSFNPALAGEVEQALLRALAKDPQQRFATCSEFTAALEAALLAADLDRFHALLEQARQLSADGQHPEARQRLEQARQLINARPDLRTALAELETQTRLAAQSEQMLKDWQTAQQKGQAVLEQFPAFPDPQAIFPVLGLRKAPPPPLEETARQALYGLLGGTAAAALFLALAFWLITHLPNN